MKDPRQDRRRSDPAARLAYFLYDFRTPQGMSEEERRSGPQRGDFEALS